MEDVEQDLEGPDGSEGDRGRQTGRVRRLIAELRSGRWPQAVGALHVVDAGEVSGLTSPGFCCLGVACEVAIADGLELERVVKSGDSAVSSTFTWYVDSTGVEESQLLPVAVQKWYGFGDDNPWLKIPDEILGDIEHEVAQTHVPGDTYAPTELNDEYRLTLQQIGDCFEYTLLPQDWEVTLQSRGRAALQVSDIDAAKLQGEPAPLVQIVEGVVIEEDDDASR